MERVSLIEGQVPIVIFAPHGFQGNDENTAVLAETLAKQFNTFAVINRGWERADAVDCIKDQADCNNVDHCHVDVVQDEILEPLLRFVKKCKNLDNNVFLYNIHGMSNNHRKKVQDNMDLVIGYGAGKPDSFTMDVWRKDFFMHKLINLGLNAYEGKAGGQFSGWARTNMNQLFRKWYFDASVQALQIEIVHELRSDKDMCLLMGDYIGTCMMELLTLVHFSPTFTYKSY